MTNQKIATKQIKKNVSLSIVAQLVSFSVSLLLNLLLPKFIAETEYSYWQTFLLYASYVPLLHFGFLDGLMLRYSQYDYDSLDKPLIRSQFKIFFCVELFFATVGMVVSFFIDNEINRLLLRFISIAIITTNTFTYTSYLFQLTNKFIIVHMVAYIARPCGVVLRREQVPVGAVVGCRDTCQREEHVAYIAVDKRLVLGCLNLLLRRLSWTAVDLRVCRRRSIIADGRSR